MGIGCALGCAPRGVLPVEPHRAPSSSSSSPIAAAIERQPICVGSSVLSAGELSRSLYYRAVLLHDGKIAVGYFVFYSEERPWGNNWLTWTVLPALGIDMFYSRSLFVAPGLQRAMYGKGDVEGFRIVYAPEPDGTLRVDEVVADDDDEHAVKIDRAHVLALDAKRPTLYSDVWSHQLGARGATSRDDLVSLHCFEAADIAPLPEELARDYHLDNRADPAHVELLGGVPIDGATAMTPEARAAASSSPPVRRGG